MLFINESLQKKNVYVSVFWWLSIWYNNLLDCTWNFESKLKNTFFLIYTKDKEVSFSTIKKCWISWMIWNWLKNVSMPDTPWLAWSTRISPRVLLSWHCADPLSNWSLSQTDHPVMQIKCLAVINEWWRSFQHEWGCWMTVARVITQIKFHFSIHLALGSFHLVTMQRRRRGGLGYLADFNNVEVGSIFIKYLRNY